MSLHDFAKHLGQWKTARVPSALLLELRPINPNGRLKDADLKVYIGLTTWGRGDGEVWARQSVIAKWLGIERTTLWRSLKRLEKVEAITIGSVKIKGEDRKLITVVTPEFFVSAVAHPVEEATEDVAPEQHVADLQHGVLHTCNVGVADLQLIRKTKKKENSKKRVSTFVETGSSISEGSKEEKNELDFKRKKEIREQKGEERREREKAGMLGAAPSTGAVVPVEQKIEDDDSGPPSRSGRRSSKPKKARAPKAKSISDPNVIAAYKAWQAEVKLKWPKSLETEINPMKAKLIRDMLAQVDHAGFLEIVRVAVWDWSAIQETVQPWYTKERPIPDLKTITFIFTQLAGLVGTGATSTRKRVSEYHQRFIAKTPENPNHSANSADGLSMAERARQKYYAERG